MRATRCLCWCLMILGWGLVASASAQQGVRWQVDLESAQRLAAQTNRMVLVHFWADWCLPCRRMEQEVFVRPDVAAAMEANYVPVKVNADHFPHTREQYGVTVLPSDVILAPDGQVIARLAGTADGSRYVSQLGQIAAAARRATPGYGQRGLDVASRQPTGPPIGSPATRAPRGQQPGNLGNPDTRFVGRVAEPQPAQVIPADQRYARPNSGRSAGPPRVKIPPASELAGSGAPASQPSAVASPAPAIQLPLGSPPLGLDGYCPVELSDRRRWVRGDPRWGLIHRGRTYLFVGPEQRDRFDADPDRYAPVSSGSDVVVAVEQGETLPGRREHGAWFEGRVYLFSSETTLRKFDANPHRYVPTMLQSAESTARRPMYGAPADQASPPGAVPQGAYGPWR